MHFKLSLEERTGEIEQVTDVMNALKTSEARINADHDSLKQENRDLLQQLHRSLHRETSLKNECEKSMAQVEEHAGLLTKSKVEYATLVSKVEECNNLLAKSEECCAAIEAKLREELETNKELCDKETRSIEIIISIFRKCNKIMCIFSHKRHYSQTIYYSSYNSTNFSILQYSLSFLQT